MVVKLFVKSSQQTAHGRQHTFLFDYRRLRKSEESGAAVTSWLL